ncbi:MAG: hypothetical protein CBE24_07650 [bacterium TMED264]|nr:MAG: hypothetical protein CBE24_07650 [bacterium TMED264]
MAKRLTEKENEKLVKGFKRGKTIKSLSEEFRFTSVTIIRKLKEKLGVSIYRELNSKNKKSAQENIIYRDKNINNDNIDSNLKDSEYKFLDINEIDEDKDEKNCPHASEFIEITPLNYEIESTSRKELSSIPISEINFPDMVYMIVDKNIELEIRYLRDYPQWDFLPDSDLNRKSIEIFNDIKVAKRFCRKEQKVIKVPNTDVFKIAAPNLISRGISRIISSEQLISL